MDSVISLKAQCNSRTIGEEGLSTVAYPGIFFEGSSTNSVEDRGQREWGSGGGSPLVRGSTQFANE
jgi:hypothetical protein